jgi:hypothetical protein
MELDGVYGRFDLWKGKITVHHFSTYATPSKAPHEAHHRNLLENLAPMRERVKADSIKDLNTLLQRDLSDDRIVSELVPYLMGKFNNVGFFPPILSVLIPKDFLEKDSKAIYPKREARLATAQTWGECWGLELFEGNRLGRLSIFAAADVIVLDGQHRANAFRYVCGALKADGAHAAFYADAPKPNEEYSSDLPVTLVWFESKAEDVAPTDVSRELFVAVNNSARRVNEARTILLNEQEVCSLSTNQYYSHLAGAAGYATGRMNLLTGSFDIDLGENLERAQPETSLTNPVLIKTALQYSYFATSDYDKLKRWKATQHMPGNMDRFRSIFGHLDYVESRSGKDAIITDVSKRKHFRTLLSERIVPLLDFYFNELTITKLHHQAVSKLEDYYKKTAQGAAKLDAWEGVLCSGEGIYSQLRDPDRVVKNASVERFTGALKEIDRDFIKIRTELALEKSKPELEGRYLTDAYGLFNTLAFQTGLFMAVSTSAAVEGLKVPASERLLKHAAPLKGVSISEWVAFFTSFNRLCFRNLEANHWPRFQKMLLRLFFDYEGLYAQKEAVLPEIDIAKQLAGERFKQAFEVDPKAVKSKVIASSVVDEIVEAFGKVRNTKVVSKDDLFKISLEEFAEQSKRAQSGSTALPEDEARI